MPSAIQLSGTHMRNKSKSHLVNFTFLFNGKISQKTH